MPSRARRAASPRHSSNRPAVPRSRKVRSACAAPDNIDLNRVGVMQVDYPNRGIALTESVDAPDALFDAHGIPRHIVVDERSAKLEVQALGCGVGAQQHICVPFSELSFHLVARDDAPRCIFVWHLPAAAREAPSDRLRLSAPWP
jgi:hypothetical protein